MKKEGKPIEVMTELLAEVHGMRKEFTGEVQALRSETKDGFDNLSKRIERLEDQQVKTNVSIQELRLSFVKLNDEISKMNNYGDRIFLLEKEVFKKAS
jgi:uncharacterized protein YdcH (DUF465 family)